MSEFSFAPTAVPAPKGAAGRKPDHNPFVDPVGELVDYDGSPVNEALTFTVPDSTWETPEVQKLTRQLAKAGKHHGVSVYKRLEPTPDGQGTVITFWTQPRHNGGRKAADATPNMGEQTEAVQVA